MNNPRDPFYVSIAPTIERIALLTHAASRARSVNEVFGSSMSPFEIARTFADEDIDILLAWLAKD